MENRKSTVWLKIFVVVTFIAMVTVNALSALLPINGITPGQVSDSYPNLFAPAGITFSIWGLIYLLLAGHALYQAGLFQGKNAQADSGLLGKVGVLFSLSSLVNTAWVFSWHYRIIPLSMLLMALLIFCLIAIMHAIHRGKLSLREKIFIGLPFSVYFGWITVATIANATVLLVSLGWGGFGLPQSLWTVIILVVGAVIGAVTTIRFQNIAYGLVLVWAYAGILIKHTSAPGFANQYTDVIVTVCVCIAVFIASILSVLITRKKKQASNQG